jgi:hypothetical protein
VAGPQQPIELPITIDWTQLFLIKPSKEAKSVDVAIPNSHNLRRTITEKLQKYTDLQEELVRIRPVDKACTIQLMLSITGNIANKLDAI